jgi:hypothetical protein
MGLYSLTSLRMEFVPVNNVPGSLYRYLGPFYRYLRKFMRVIEKFKKRLWGLVVVP